MNRETIQKDIRDIIDKWIGKQNTDFVRNNIKTEIKNYLDNLINEGIVDKFNYNIDIQCHDKDTVNLRIYPEIRYVRIIIKYIYTGDDIETHELKRGQILDVMCDRFTLEPIQLILPDSRKMSPKARIHKDYFKSMFERGIFINLAEFREDRINQILED